MCCARIWFKIYRGKNKFPGSVKRASVSRSLYRVARAQLSGSEPQQHNSEQFPFSLIKLNSSQQGGGGGALSHSKSLEIQRNRRIECLLGYIRSPLRTRLVEQGVSRWLIILHVVILAFTKHRPPCLQSTLQPKSVRTLGLSTHTYHYRTSVSTTARCRRTNRKRLK